MPETRTKDDVDTVTKISDRSVNGTVARLTELIARRGMHLFAVIDQAAEAKNVGLQLRETTMVIFGSPVAARDGRRAAGGSGLAAEGVGLG